MARLKISGFKTTKNTIIFDLRNNTEKIIKFRYSCRVFDKDGHAITSSTPDNSFVQNHLQRLDPNNIKQLGIVLDGEVSEGMMFVCDIEEVDGKNSDNYTVTFKLHIKYEWK